MYRVRAWEHGIPTCNLVEAELVNVHIDFPVFEVFTKCACKCIIDLLPFKLDVLVYNRLGVFIDQ